MEKKFLKGKIKKIKKSYQEVNTTPATGCEISIDFYVETCRKLRTEQRS